MPRKKHPSLPSTATKPSTQPISSKKASPLSSSVSQQPGNRWQRSKRYGWDSR